MPFRSKSQKGFLYAKHPDIAKRWQAETPTGVLPEHAKKKVPKGSKFVPLKKR